MALSKEEVISEGIELMSLLDMDTEQVALLEERGQHSACAEAILSSVEGETEQETLLDMLRQVMDGTYDKEDPHASEKEKQGEEG